jgi:pimeloyl-ACP methyl ester carboxylesterase
MIQYEVHSPGKKALVFVHCWCCDRTYWRNQIDRFKDKYSVVTLDLAGHGESGMNREEYSIDAYGQDVAAVVNKLGLNDVILIGHSMGGMVIIKAAQKLPGKVTALVGVDNYRNFERVASDEEKEAFLQPMVDDFENQVYGFVKWMFPDSADSALVEWTAGDMAEAPGEVGVESMRAIMTFNYLTELEDNQIPMRAINGEKFPTDIEACKRVTPLIEFTIIPGTGHFPHLEKPDEFNQALQGYLDELWPE